jgi:hypothetical protein
VTEPRSPLESALDLFVYVPVGLAFTAAEEIPKLAAKGRSRVGGQLTTAKVIGHFVVAQGRKELDRRFRQTGPGGGERGEPSSTRLSEPAGGERSEPSSTRLGESAGGERGEPSDARLAGPSGARTGRSAAPGPGEPRGDGPGESPLPSGRRAANPPGAADALDLAAMPVPTAARLGIPGYDSLSASQVVQRLAGLSNEELVAVGAYETAHRARRTVLTRVNQLLSD